MSRNLSEGSEDGIRELLLGRRVVAAEMGDFEFSDSEWGDHASGKLTLDDGRVVYVLPNDGGCSCGAGDYYLTSLATVDNIITAVTLTSETDADDYREGPTKYQIFVVADAVQINLLTIDGDDGNGYYGTGYTLTVVDPVGVVVSPTQPTKDEK